ncbi:MAG: hypothetical protein AAF191_15225 [Verrucomicrobiota bacterium]
MAEELLRQMPPNMSGEQRSEFQDWFRFVGRQVDLVSGSEKVEEDSENLRVLPYREVRDRMERLGAEVGGVSFKAADAALLCGWVWVGEEEGGRFCSRVAQMLYGSAGARKLNANHFNQLAHHGERFRGQLGAPLLRREGEANEFCFTWEGVVRARHLANVHLFQRADGARLPPSGMER